MPRWHTDYTPDEHGIRATCPYCLRHTVRPVMSQAVKAGQAHEQTCQARLDAIEADRRQQAARDATAHLTG